MPDFFVPLDTTRYTKYHRELAAKSIVLNANLRYVDRQRKKLKAAYPTFEQYQKGYEVPASLLETIVKEGEKKNIKPKDDAEKEKTMAALKVQLKALVARDLWDMTEYYAVFNEESDIVKRALKVILKEEGQTNSDAE